jgi:hypothetical protein
MLSFDCGTTIAILSTLGEGEDDDDDLDESETSMEEDCRRPQAKHSSSTPRSITRMMERSVRNW